MERGREVLARFSWRLWRTMLGAFVVSPEGRRGTSLFAALLVLLVAINVLNVMNSYVGRDFMAAIAARSMQGFASMAVIHLSVLAASTVAAVIYRFTEERLGLLCREWLTRRLVGRYLAGDTYYWLRERSAVGAPDQRIAEDVRAFTATTISLILILLNSILTVFAISGVMWSISPLLFGVAAAYAVLGSGLMMLFGRSLIWLSYDQVDREASLRAELVHLRENAESFAVPASPSRRMTHSPASTRSVSCSMREVRGLQSAS